MNNSSIEKTNGKMVNGNGQRMDNGKQMDKRRNGQNKKHGNGQRNKRDSVRITGENDPRLHKQPTKYVTGLEEAQPHLEEQKPLYEDEYPELTKPVGTERCEKEKPKNIQKVDFKTGRKMKPKLDFRLANFRYLEDRMPIIEKSTTRLDIYNGACITEENHRLHDQESEDQKADYSEYAFEVCHMDLDTLLDYKVQLDYEWASMTYAVRLASERLRHKRRFCEIRISELRSLQLRLEEIKKEKYVIVLSENEEEEMEKEVHQDIVEDTCNEHEQLEAHSAGRPPLLLDLYDSLEENNPINDFDNTFEELEFEFEPMDLIPLEREEIELIDWNKENIVEEDFQAFNMDAWRMREDPVYQHWHGEFFRNVAVTAQSAEMSLRFLALVPSQEDKESIKKMIRSMPYVIYAINLSQPELEEMSNEHLISSVMYLKAFFEWITIEEYEQYMEAHTPQPVQWITTAMEAVMNSVGRGAQTMAEVILSAWTTMFRKINDLLGSVSTSLTGALGKISEGVVGLITKILGDVSLLEIVKTKFEAVKSIVVKMMIAIAVVFFGAIGFLGIDGVKTILRGFTNTNTTVNNIYVYNPEDKLEAHTGEEGKIYGALSLAIAIGLGIFGLKSEDKKQFRDKVTLFMTLFAGGVVANSVLVSLFTLLPAVLKNGLIIKFGTPEMKRALQLETWVLKVQTLTASARTSQIVNTPQYQTMMEEVMQQGCDFYKVVEGVQRPVFLRLFLNLFTTYQGVLASRIDRGSRPEPLAVHIFGKPGLGKSSLIGPLVKEAFGMPSDMVFQVPKGQEHWNGFANEKLIHIDEFMNSETRSNQDDAKMYQLLVSSTPFQPPLASVDNIAVGIKGTHARPDYVFTTSYSAYFAADGYDIVALNRRRALVVEMDVSDPKYKGLGTNSFSRDVILQLSPEEVQERSWLKFRTHPIIPMNGAPVYKKNRAFNKTEAEKVQEDGASEWFGFRDLVNLIRGEDHKRKVAHMILNPDAAAEGGKMGDPAKMLEDIMRSLARVPDKSFSLSELLMETFSAQGPPCQLEGHGGKKKPKRDDREPVIYLEDRESSTETEVSETSSQVSQADFQSDPGSGVFEAGELYGDELPQYKDQQPSHLARMEDSAAQAFASIKSLHSGTPSLMYFPEITWGKKVLPGLKGLAKLVAVTAGVVSLVVLINRLMRPDGKKEETLSFVSNSVMPHREQRKENRRNKFDRGYNYHDMESQSVLGIEPAYLGTPMGTIKVLPLVSRESQNWVCTYLHGISAITVETGVFEATLDYKGKPYLVKVDLAGANVCEDRDVIFFQVYNNQLPKFKNILNLFIEDTIIDLTETYAVGLEIASGTVYTRTKKAYNKSYRLARTQQTLERGLYYDCEARKGDCGSPIVVTSGPYAGKILGFHVAGSMAVREGSQGHGLATILDKDFVNQGIQPAEIQVDETSDFDANGPLEEGGNIKVLMVIPPNEQVFVNRISKIKATKFNGNMGEWRTEKQPPVLTEMDPRNEVNMDPIVVSLEAMKKTEQVPVNLGVLKVCKLEACTRLRTELKWPVEKRLLSWDESMFGIPGKLKSINTLTSCGYPLVQMKKKKGKQDFVWFDREGAGHYDPILLVMVEHLERAVLECDSDSRLRELADEHRFVGFLKDETRKVEKIRNAETRVIYCNDLVAMVLFRKYYGSLLSALCHSWETSSIATGMNQYSFDMDRLYDNLMQLNPDGFIAGDYKQFDMHMQQQFQKAAYEILNNLMKDSNNLVPKNMQKYLYYHETQSSAQLGKYRFWTHCNMMSGCFFTTAVNCIVNDLYFRYVWKQIYPSKFFDENVRGIYQGDDHVLAVTKGNTEFNPLRIGVELARIGQVYTTADKVSELDERLIKFEEVTFLGALPIRINNNQGTKQWTGQMKWETIIEALSWTSDDGKTLSQVVETMLGYASLHSKEKFNALCQYIYETDYELYTGLKPQPGWATMRSVVPNRTAVSGEVFFSHGPEKQASGITGLYASQTVLQPVRLKDHKSHNTHLAVSEDSASLAFGTESKVWRAAVPWVNTDMANTVLAQWEVPRELLSAANTSNVQNMPFERYIYFHTDMEIIFQVAGTPFQAGRLIASFRPLMSKEDGNIGVGNDMMLSHVILSPNKSITTSLYIPFRSFRACMNTFAQAMGHEYMGVVSLEVITPLTTGGDDLTATVNVYTRFPRAKFAIPRPIAVGTHLEDMINVEEYDRLEGHGGGLSRISYNYNLGSVAGPVNLSSANNPSVSGAKVDAKAELSIPPIPLDNPPVAGLVVPTIPQMFPMSKNCDIKLTQRLGFSNAVIDTDHLMKQDPQETNLGSILARKNLYASFSWSKVTPVGSTVYSAPLHSFLMNVTGSTSTPFGIPNNIAILNWFKYWRADVIFEFEAVRTDFHNGRLLATIGFGAPTSSVTPVNKNIYYNQILDFTNNNDIAVVRIPYNSANQFLQTYEGEGFTNQIQDFSMGTLLVTILDKLQATNTVASSITVLVKVSFENVRLHEMRPGNSVIFRRNIQSQRPITMTGSVAPPTVLNEMMEAQGPPSGVETMKDNPSNETAVEQVITSSSEKQSNVPYHIDKKFPDSIEDVVQVLRRYYQISPQFVSKTVNVALAKKFIYFPVTIQHPLAELYSTWAGSLHYRIMVKIDSSFNNWISYARFLPYSEIGGFSSASANLLTMSGKVFYPSLAGLNTGLHLGQILLETGQIVRSFAPTAAITPIEMLAAVGQVQVIDISVPYNTIYEQTPTPVMNYNQTNNRIGISEISKDSGVSPIIGLIMLHVPSIADLTADIQVYQSVGDDFRLMNFCGGNTAFCPYEDQSTGAGATFGINTVVEGFRRTS